MNLENKYAIVTGSTKGIGRAVAEALLEEGAQVVISSRHQEEIDETVEEFSTRGSSRVIGQRCDVQNAEEVQKLIQTCVTQFGGLNVLINNAGVGDFEEVEKMSLEGWRNTLRTNLDALFYASHYAIPEMKKAKNGFIINIGSLAGKNAFAGGGAYNASKFGLVGFSEALMQEVRHDDIRVAYIMPGSVDTWFRGGAPEGGDTWKLTPQDVAEVVIQTLKRHPRCLTSRIEMRPSKPPRK